MSGSFTARVIRVEFDTGETGRIYATSPDLKGLMIGRHTMGELQEALPQAIAALYEAAGEQVFVLRATGDAVDGEAWVTMPVAVAQQALSAATVAA
jgi:hypothetical protein